MKVILETITEKMYSSQIDFGCIGYYMPESELTHVDFENFAKSLVGKSVHVITDNPLMLKALNTFLSVTEYRLNGLIVETVQPLFASFADHFQKWERIAHNIEQK